MIAADSAEGAQHELHLVKRLRVKLLYGRQGRTPTEAETDAILASEGGRQIEQMVVYSAVGRPAEVKDYLEHFAKHAGADELIVAHQHTSTEGRLRSVQLTAEAMSLGA